MHIKLLYMTIVYMQKTEWGWFDRGPDDCETSDRNKNKKNIEYHKMHNL